MARLINFVLYQTGWLACVFGAALSRPWTGSTIAAGLMIVHLFLATHRLNQVRLLMAAIAVGLIADLVLLNSGVFQFSHGIIIEGLPPLWMTLLWMQFATTFRYCLAWLSGRYMTSALLGLVGAPLAFLGGERIGAVALLTPRLEHLLLLGAVWCLAIPILILVSDTIYSRTATPDSYRGFGLPESNS